MVKPGARTRTAGSGRRGKGNAAAARPNVEQLSDYLREELDALFATLAAPEHGQPNGRLRGRLFGMLPGSLWPRALLRLQTCLLGGGLGLWAGKTFRGSRGANLVGSLAAGRKVGFFRSTPGTAEDGQPALLLDYDVPQNPWFMRAILGELRILGPGTYLARMRWRVGERAVTILYFTLQEDD